MPYLYPKSTPPQNPGLEFRHISEHIPERVRVHRTTRSARKGLLDGLFFFLAAWLVAASITVLAWIGIGKAIGALSSLV